MGVHFSRYIGIVGIQGKRKGYWLLHPGTHL